MKVMTLDTDGLAASGARLQMLVGETYNPDLVVGIARGGAYVAQNMFAAVRHVSVTCRRPSSSRKDSHGALLALVRRLPLWMRDTMRRIEARWLAGNGDPGREVTAGADVWQTVAGAGCILVVDDAVDSGHSLKAVVEEIRRRNPSAEIRSAVVTVTTVAPVMPPDYTLYSQILLRFPWSGDYR